MSGHRKGRNKWQEGRNLRISMRKEGEETKMKSKCVKEKRKDLSKEGGAPLEAEHGDAQCLDLAKESIFNGLLGKRCEMDVSESR